MTKRNPCRLFATAFVLFTLASCINPAEAYVRADEETYRIVEPQLRTYLDADQSLDTASKAVYVDVLRSWRLRLDRQLERLPDGR